jgi:hypothetical protein
VTAAAWADCARENRCVLDQACALHDVCAAACLALTRDGDTQPAAP